MENGFKIFWTDNALFELDEIFDYLEYKWTEREIKNFAKELEKTLLLLSQNPELFQASESKPEIRRVVISKLNSLYYRVNIDTVEILSFFLNRKDPKNRNV